MRNLGADEARKVGLLLGKLITFNEAGQALNFDDILTNLSSILTKINCSIEPYSVLHKHLEFSKLFSELDDQRVFLIEENLWSKLSETYSDAQINVLKAYVNGLREGYKKGLSRVQLSMMRKPSRLEGISTILLVTFIVSIVLLGMNQFVKYLERTTQSDGSLKAQDPSLLIPEADLNPEVLNENIKQGVSQLKPLPPALGQNIKLPQISGSCISQQAKEPILEEIADKTNFGERLAVDWKRMPIPHTPQIIVLHETVVNERQTVNLFKTPHSNDTDQSSYHMLIGLDGKRIRIVPDDKRAFGAGESAFAGQTIKAKKESKGSINNVALHVSLVTPIDGQTNGETRHHSGYKHAQYDALAEQIIDWQLKYGIPSQNITTHAAVDQSGTRHDPRSFEWLSLRIAMAKYIKDCRVKEQD